MKIAHAAAYECNGEPILADAFYAIACDPRRSVAVEACAGAGKTWMLVSRIVRALLDGVTAAPGQQVLPHEILAITFTKKAAGEMRERLDDWLKAFAHADDETLQRELEMRGVRVDFSSQKGQVRTGCARAAIKFIPFHSGQRPPVQIRTFHSWFAALLRSAPVAVLQRLGLPVNYELLEDDKEPVRALVWRRFYAAVEPMRRSRPTLKPWCWRMAVSRLTRRLQARRSTSGWSSRWPMKVGVVDTSVRAFQHAVPRIFAALMNPKSCSAPTAFTGKR
jgi:ATP-dependent helicase/nuclease subunit A